MLACGSDPCSLPTSSHQQAATSKQPRTLCCGWAGAGCQPSPLRQPHSATLPSAGHGQQPAKCSSHCGGACSHAPARERWRGAAPCSCPLSSCAPQHLSLQGNALTPHRPPRLGGVGALGAIPPPTAGGLAPLACGSQPTSRGRQGIRPLDHPVRPHLSPALMPCPSALATLPWVRACFCIRRGKPASAATSCRRMPCALHAYFPASDAPS